MVGVTPCVFAVFLVYTALLYLFCLVLLFSCEIGNTAPVLHISN